MWCNSMNSDGMLSNGDYADGKSMAWYDKVKRVIVMACYGIVLCGKSVARYSAAYLRVA